MACSGQFAETFINFLVLIHNCSCNVEAFLCDHYTLLLHDRSFKQNILRDLPVLCSLAVYDPLQKCGRYWSKSDSETEMKSWFLLVIYVKMWVNIVCLLYANVEYHPLHHDTLSVLNGQVMNHILNFIKN